MRVTKGKWVMAATGVLFIAGVGLAQGPEGRGEARQGGREGRRGPGMNWDDPRTKEALGLSDDQIAKLKAQGFAQMKESVRVRSQIRVARIELEELMTSAAPDEKAVAAKAKEIGDLSGRMVQSRISARLSVKKLLTPEQQQKLREMARERMRERGRGPGPDGPAPRERFRPQPRPERPGEGVGGDDDDPDFELDENGVR